MATCEHSCFGCGKPFTVEFDPQTGRWWGIIGLCKHPRAQRGKGPRGRQCPNYYRGCGFYDSSKRANSLCLDGISKHTKRPRVDEEFTPMHGLAGMPNCPGPDATNRTTNRGLSALLDSAGANQLTTHGLGQPTIPRANTQAAYDALADAPQAAEAPPQEPGPAQPTVHFEAAPPVLATQGPQLSAEAPLVELMRCHKLPLGSYDSMMRWAVAPAVGGYKLEMRQAPRKRKAALSGLSKLHNSPMGDEPKQALAPGWLPRPIEMASRSLDKGRLGVSHYLT